MDRAYEGNETRQLAGFGVHAGGAAQVQPLGPVDVQQAWYRRRNEIERLFRRLKGFRRIFSRFDKLDVMFMGFLCFVLIVEAIR
jgi:transposase